MLTHTVVHYEQTGVTMFYLQRLAANVYCQSLLKIAVLYLTAILTSLGLTQTFLFVQET